MYVTSRSLRLSTNDADHTLDLEAGATRKSSSKRGASETSSTYSDRPLTRQRTSPSSGAADSSPSQSSHSPFLPSSQPDDDDPMDEDDADADADADVDVDADAGQGVQDTSKDVDMFEQEDEEEDDGPPMPPPNQGALPPAASSSQSTTYKDAVLTEDEPSSPGYHRFIHPPFHQFCSSFASQRTQTSISLANSSRQLRSGQLSLLLPLSHLPFSHLLLPQSASAQTIVCILPLSSTIPHNNPFLFNQQYPLSFQTFVRHPFLSQFLHTYSHTSRDSKFRTESNHNTPHPQRP